MKCFCAVLLMGLVAVAACGSSGEDVGDQWEDYKKTYNKHYDHDTDLKKFEIFKKKLVEIDEHNKKYEKGEVTWTKGINQFTDLTDEEFAKINHGLNTPPNNIPQIIPPQGKKI